MNTGIALEANALEAQAAKAHAVEAHALEAHALEVLAPGVLTTVQDQGRDGWRHLGVARAGALDPAQAALANRLVGNRDDDAVLELTLGGPTLVLPRPLRIAICGASIDAAFECRDGTRHPLPCARPVALPAGVLRLGAIRDGARAWLAISGGIDVPRVLGSRSTDLRGGFGGLDGRALRIGDRLPLGASQNVESSIETSSATWIESADRPGAPAWWISLDAPEATTAARHTAVRFVAAAENDGTRTAAALLLDRDWRVDPRSDRQGLRLDGDAIATTLPERISAPAAPGIVQLPPDGRPIVLLADAQTIGGYPRLGYVIAADLPRLAQLRGGDRVRMQAVDAAVAQAALRRRRDEIARLQCAIDDRLRGG